MKLLQFKGATQDQAGLGKRERFENLHGKMTVVSKATAARSAVGNPSTLILIDDIVTTGATLLEMRRSLSAVGLEAEFFATFAETL